ncbi:MAG: class I SAM-dependent methyltransferase [Caulobacteraceae bacterium]
MTGEAVYGAPPADLAVAAPDARRLSPFDPASVDLESLSGESLTRAIAAAPPGVLERRFVLAHLLRALRPGGELIALAPKDKGGARLNKELEAFGCAPSESPRRHHRICRVHRPDAPVGLDAAIAAGALQVVPDLGLWSQPGVFSWNRLDPGSALLLETARDFAGTGADLGCGVGLLGKALLTSPAVAGLTFIDLDRRALAAARRNVDDARAAFVHGDVRSAPGEIDHLDFVIMNPPFHDGGHHDRELGRAFIAAAASGLKAGGRCRLVANVALPYEQSLSAHFREVSLIAQARGYKVLEARK